MDRMRKAAAVSVAVLFVYYEMYRWVPLGKWNWQFRSSVSNDQFYPDIVIGMLLLVFAWSFAQGKRAGMIAGAALLTLWSVVHCFDWWIPYARSLPEAASRFSYYEPHTQLLPVIGYHYPPDGGHVVLDFILFPTCVLALSATIKTTLSRG